MSPLWKPKRLKTSLITVKGALRGRASPAPHWKPPLRYQRLLNIKHADHLSNSKSRTERGPCNRRCLQSVQWCLTHVVSAAEHYYFIN